MSKQRVTDQSADAVVLGGRTFLREQAFAKSKRVSTRTVKRWRAAGMRHLQLGYYVYVPTDEADQFLLDRMRGRNPRRRR
jgi:hypothetical protein